MGLVLMDERELYRIVVLSEVMCGTRTTNSATNILGPNPRHRARRFARLRHIWELVVWHMEHTAMGGKYVEIFDFADGQLEPVIRDVSLPYRIFDKKQYVEQGTIVEKKR